MKGCESTSKWSLLNKYPYKNQIYSFILIVFMWKLFNLVTDFLALVFLLVLYTLAVMGTQTVIHIRSISRQFPVPM